MVMAYVGVIIGDYNTALEYLDEVLGMPSIYSPQFIEGDPLWAPLKDDPRFKEIIQRHKGEVF